MTGETLKIVFVCLLFGPLITLAWGLSLYLIGYWAVKTWRALRNRDKENCGGFGCKGGPYGY